MVIKWKSRRISRLQVDEYCWGNNVSAELLKPYRDEQKRPRQRYIANLGSFTEYCKNSGTTLIDDMSLVRFWTSAWKRLFYLGLSTDETRMVVDALKKRTEEIPEICAWYPDGFRGFGEWSQHLLRMYPYALSSGTRRCFLSPGSEETFYRLAKDFSKNTNGLSLPCSLAGGNAAR